MEQSSSYGMATRRSNRRQTQGASNCIYTRSKKIKVSDDRNVNEESDQNVDRTTTSIGATTVSGNFVELPPELLSIILEYLSSRDLKTYREINSMWKSATSWIVRARQSYHIVFSSGHHAMQRKKSKPITQLKYLNSQLKKAKKMNSLIQFPSTSMEFQNVSLDTKNMQEFFTLYGPFIKKLRLTSCKTRVNVNKLNGDNDDKGGTSGEEKKATTSTSEGNDDDGQVKEIVDVTPTLGLTPDDDGQLHALARLLLNQAPNIDNLTISGHLFTTMGAYDACPIDQRMLFSDTTTKLPNLTRFRSGFERRLDMKMMEEILESANNLQVFDTKGFRSTLPLDMLSTMNKIDTLKSMSISISSSRLAFCEKLAALKPKLQTVSFKLGSIYRRRKEENNLSRASSVISKILESSRQTLENIEEFYPVGFFTPGIKIPVMEKLKKMTIVNEFGGSCITGTVFPTGQDLSTAFPKLEEVSIRLLDVGRMFGSVKGEEFCSTFFPFINGEEEQCQLPTVHTLKMSRMPLDACQQLMWWFPNIRKLVIDCYLINREDLPPILQNVWHHMKQLESIEITNVKNTQYLVSALTGEKAEEEEEEILDKEDEEEVKEEKKSEPQLSIRELKELKSLVISFAAYAYTLDTHIERLVELLVSLKSLQYLRVKGVKFTEVALESVKGALWPYADVQLATNENQQIYEDFPSDTHSSSDDSYSGYSSSSSEDMGPAVFGFGFGLLGMLLGLGVSDESDSD